MKLTLTPESLRETLPDLELIQGYGRRSAASLWVTVLAIALPGLALLRAPLPRFEYFPWWVDLLSVPLALIAGLFLTISLHELGHIAAL